MINRHRRALVRHLVNTPRRTPDGTYQRYSEDEAEQAVARTVDFIRADRQFRRMSNRHRYKQTQTIPMWFFLALHQLRAALTSLIHAHANWRTLLYLACSYTNNQTQSRLRSRLATHLPITDPEDCEVIRWCRAHLGYVPEFLKPNSKPSFRTLADEIAFRLRWQGMSPSE